MSELSFEVKAPRVEITCGCEAEGVFSSAGDMMKFVIDLAQLNHFIAIVLGDFSVNKFTHLLDRHDLALRSLLTLHLLRLRDLLLKLAYCLKIARS